MVAPTPAEDPVVLCVDDDPATLSALRRALGREPYRVVTSASAEEALRRLERGGVRLVISDQRMPGMSGAEFLERVRRTSPDTIRVLLTGYPESGLVSYGLTRGVDWLISKPWSDLSLKGALRQLLADREEGPGRLPGASEHGAADPRLVAEITRRLGSFPPPLRTAARVPGVLRALWSEMKACYLDAPFPALFKEKLFTTLARNPYVRVAHARALAELGLSPREIAALRERAEPPPELGPAPATSAAWAEAEDALFRRASRVFHGGPDAARARDELRAYLGEDLDGRLRALLTFIAHSDAWADARPEITPESDPRLAAWKATAEAEEPRLVEHFAGRREAPLPERRGDEGARAQRFLAAGQLSAGFAHEIHEGLDYVLSNLAGMKEYLDDLERALRGEAGEMDVEFVLRDFRSALEETRESAEEIQETARDLRDFPGADDGELADGDPRELLEDALRLCRHALKRRAELKRDYEPLPRIACRPGPLREALVNLILNAVHAVEGGGEIRVSLREEEGRP
jgi:CheY-like chemotaxis protein/signal transduction histidine kinase